ncbi:MAG TPA: sulfotransferase domain-containing protein [Rhizomicrobium sp.]|nr:sulfotransferase domain-containing protein [Rhizomicrobium sp.]
MQPRKTREIHNHHFDSTIWNDLRFRDDDIVVATYGKSGTTWLQQIVGQLIFSGAEDVPVAEISPWLDLRVPPKPVKLPMVEAQTHRRFLKTHLPVDALVFSATAKYLFVARDGRDVVWSFHHHHATANATWYGMLNDTPGLVGEKMPPMDLEVVPYFRRWLERDGYPFWSFWEIVRSWWEIRALPNVMLLHYNDMKADLPGAIRKVASFLDIEIEEGRWDAIVEHCGFAYMKAHADKSAPLGGVLWEGGAGSFINKGTNGRWRDMLSIDDNRNYEARALKELGPDCAHWLATGERQDEASASLARPRSMSHTQPIEIS